MHPTLSQLHPLNTQYSYKQGVTVCDQSDQGQIQWMGSPQLTHKLLSTEALQSRLEEQNPPLQESADTQVIACLVLVVSDAELYHWAHICGQTLLLVVDLCTASVSFPTVPDARSDRALELEISYIWNSNLVGRHNQTERKT